MAGNRINIIGGGLAGAEAAWQALHQGCEVRLFEMRPKTLTPAHKTGSLAELVCSNSMKSLSEASAPGLLKKEMGALGSLIVSSAHDCSVPAGQALAVDRKQFSQLIQQRLESFGTFELVTDEVVTIPSSESLDESGEVWVVASGPLTSAGLSKSLLELCHEDSHLHFYDAIAPVIDGETIDRSEVFRASRWQEGEGDYLNISLNKDQYLNFIAAVKAAEKVPLHNFEQVKYFESCLPIEVMVERGDDTLRFGPLKPAGIDNPKTGRWAYANIQLRMEDRQGSMYSMVGFQTKMKYPEQERIFRTLPGLQDAEFLKLGSVHRNTYLDSPRVLKEDLSFNKSPNIFLAGQITGVEGYTESAAIGLLAGRFAAAKLLGKTFLPPPAGTMMGALLNHVVRGNRGEFTPMNANLGLLPTVAKERGVGKAERKSKQCQKAWQVFETYRQGLGDTFSLGCGELL